MPNYTHKMANVSSSQTSFHPMYSISYRIVSYPVVATAGCRRGSTDADEVDRWLSTRGTWCLDHRTRNRRTIRLANPISGKYIVSCRLAQLLAAKFETHHLAWSCLVDRLYEGVLNVVISARLPTEHSLFHAHVPLSATEVLLSQDRVCGTVYRLLYDRSPATDSLGNVWNHIYSRPRNRSALWLVIIVRYANTLTYLLTYQQP